MGAKVKLRGFEVGKVKQVEFYPEPQKEGVFFVVELAIKNEYPVIEGTVGEVKGGGIVGDSFINLDVSSQGHLPFKAGATVKGKEALDTGTLMAKAVTMLERMTEMSERIRDAEIGGRFKKFVEVVHKISTDVEGLSKDAQSMLTRSESLIATVEPGLKKSIDKLNEDLDYSKETLTSLNEILGDNSENIKDALEALQRSLNQMEKLMSNLDNLTVENRAQIDSTLKNMEDISASFKDVARHPWKIIFGGVKGGQGDSRQ